MSGFMHRTRMLGVASIIIGLTLTSAVTIAETKTKTVKIYNPTHYAIVALQAKRPTESEWQPDMLGKTALGVGKLVDINLAIEPDCVYDLRATFDDGRKIEKPKVDICKIEVYQFTDK